MLSLVGHSLETGGRKMEGAINVDKVASFSVYTGYFFLEAILILEGICHFLFFSE